MEARKIRDEEDARACLTAAMDLKLSPLLWAHAHGVDARSLNAWRVALSRRDKNRKPIAHTLVELVPSIRHQTARYGVSCGGFRVEFDDGFSGETLARVLHVLRRC
jgi:hypothetical protein